MVGLVSDTDRSCQLLDLLIYMVGENSFMSWRVVFWVIPDVNPLNRFGLIPTWLVLLQIKLCINIMLIMTMIYEGTLLSFLCENYLWGNDAQILW